MSDEREQRRLAAIIAADVVGYSTMVERDESRNNRTLEEAPDRVLLS